MTQTKPTSIPYNGTGTINIHINNPTAGVGASMPYSMPPYPVYPYYCYPPGYYLGHYNGGITQNTNINMPANPYDPLKVTKSTDNKGADSSAGAHAKSHASSESNKQNDAGKKQREIVVLTDNYIKNLENYLRNPNVELRKDAIKEILQRFKEDKSRINNPSLTALLNIALQDPNSTVKAVAMSIISSGYAQGNAQTEQILKGLQKTKTAYSTDAIQAADSLLKMSQVKKMVPDNSHYPSKDRKGK